MNKDVRSILLDIEGTTTPIAFVHDVLFGYARAQVRDFLTNHTEEVQADIALLREEHAEDVAKNRQPPPLDQDLESLAGYIDWLIVKDRKSTGLKSLQGKIWREGYLNGSLKSQVYPDVAPALERWHAAGLNISIFSSGSVLAQQVLFEHTEAGDLTRFISNYFDTNVGKKGEAQSYRDIAAALNLKPEEMMFVSDIVTELEAAEAAGMKVVLSIRPGNQPQNGADRYHAVHSFDQI